MEQAVKSFSMKMVSVFASLCLALALVPALAFATTSTTGTITLAKDAIEVAVGDTAELAGLLSATCDADYHFDFVANDAGGECFAVNKHSGVLTATAATGTEDAFVTVYLLDDVKGSSNPDSPCSGYEVLDTATITVTVTDSESVEYGYQGSGFSIMLTSPTVTGVSVDGTTYTNTVEAQKAGSTVEFTYYQSAGLNQYLNYYETWEFDSPEDAYQALAGQYISYAENEEDGAAIAESSTIEVTKVTSSTVTISVPVSSSANTATLSFGSGLHTFNQSDIETTNKSLGVNIDFEFTVE